MENPSIWLAVAAGAGAIAAFWNQIKSFIDRLVSHVIVTIEMDDCYAMWAVSHFAFSQLKRSPIGTRKYTCYDTFVRPRSRHQIVAGEIVGSGPLLFWKKWKPVWISQEAGQNGGMSKLKLSFLRWTFKQDEIMLSAVETYNRASMDGTKRFCVIHVFGSYTQKDTNGQPKPQANSSPKGVSYSNGMRLLQWSKDDLGAKRAVDAPFSFLSTTPEMEVAIQEARFWKDNEKWYGERMIPWKRGWAIHGEPGTGKTSFARAVAEELDMPVYVFDLSSLSNEEMRTSWSNMLRHTPCMALIEDIDGVFHGRQNIAVQANIMSTPLTFDCLLNCLDGIERSDGLFTVVTTNNPQHLDEALVKIGKDDDGESMGSRPGRIDRVLHLSKPTKAGLEKICKRILPDMPESWDTVVSEGAVEGDTPARFQERCARLALSRKWRQMAPVIRPSVVI